MADRSQSTPALVTSRPFLNDDDFWKVYQLLVETYPITPLDFNWEVRRWEGQRFYNADPSLDPAWCEKIRLWETAEGRVVGAAHPEISGTAFLQIHPDYREIEEEMIVWAGEHLAILREDGRRELTFFVYEYDTLRQRLLMKHGYTKTGISGMIRRLRFDHRVREAPELPGGYHLRNTRPDEADAQRIADLLNAAFNRDFHNAAEYRQFTLHAPSFRTELDLVAEAPDGSFAAYVGVLLDEANRRGIFEPVCTHPNHRQKGLAHSLMLEGLNRLQLAGAQEVTVGTGDAVPANALYDSLGFSEAYQGYEWQKVL